MTPADCPICACTQLCGTRVWQQGSDLVLGLVVFSGATVWQLEWKHELSSSVRLHIDRGMTQFWLKMAESWVVNRAPNHPTFLHFWLVANFPPCCFALGLQSSSPWRVLLFVAVHPVANHVNNYSCCGVDQLVWFLQTVCNAAFTSRFSSVSSCSMVVVCPDFEQ